MEAKGIVKIPFEVECDTCPLKKGCLVTKTKYRFPDIFKLTVSTGECPIVQKILKEEDK